jgi:hypothetical protein
MYEFILVNLYTKISKKIASGWDFNPGPISALEIVALCHPPPRPLRQWQFFLYRRIRKKNTIRKLRLYKFIRVAYSHPHFDRWTKNITK